MQDVLLPNDKSTPDTATFTLIDGLVSLLLVLVILLAFRPVLSAGFIAWDDIDNAFKNTLYQGLHASNVKWMFTTMHMSVYIPLTWLTFAFDYRLWGLNPRGYHLTNLLLHAANAVLVYTIARCLFMWNGSSRSRDPRTWAVTGAAAFAALAFALHPLRVESVAWITERRDVLSGFFFLLTILFYLYAHTRPEQHRFWWLASLGTYLLSLLSKATGVTLPVLLILLDYGFFPHGTSCREGWRDSILEKLPYVLMALPIAWLALQGQRTTGAAAPWGVFDLRMRMSVASFGVLFYLGKTVWPFQLCPLYRLPEMERFREWPFPGYVALVILITAGLFLRRKQWKALWISWLWYVILLFPLSGFFQSGGQIAADRYSYLPCLSWAVVAGGILLQSTERLEHVRRGRGYVCGLMAGAFLITAGLGGLTFRQSLVWHDTFSFWTYVLRVDPRSPTAHTNLGAALAERGDLPAAVDHFEAALREDPLHTAASENLQRALRLLHREPAVISNPRHDSPNG